MALLGNQDRFEYEYIFALLRRASVSAMAVVIASVIVGCATTAPVEEEEEEEKPAPVVEEKKVEVAPPLEFDKIYFGYNKHSIKSSAKSSLKKAVDQLLEQADAKINIEGHCDERGTDQYNIDLGWKRAYEVRDYLKRLGVDESRMFPISYGRARPATIGHDETFWSRNRRVEVSERK